MTTQGPLEQSTSVVHRSVGVWQAMVGVSQKANGIEVEVDVMQSSPPQSASVEHPAAMHCPTAGPQRQISPVAQSESRTHPYEQSQIPHGPPREDGSQ